MMLLWPMPSLRVQLQAVLPQLPLQVPYEKAYRQHLIQ
jgi:hypothetical protein